MNRIEMCFALGAIDDYLPELARYASDIQRYTHRLQHDVNPPWLTSWMQQRIMISHEMVGRYLEMVA